MAIKLTLETDKNLRAHKQYLRVIVRVTVQANVTVVLAAMWQKQKHVFKKDKARTKTQFTLHEKDLQVLPCLNEIYYRFVSSNGAWQNAT